MRASKSSALNSRDLPFISCAFTLIFFARLTSAETPGTLKHPSRPSTSPSWERICGLIYTFSLPRLASGHTTMMRLSTPTCGAAIPTPSSSCMVSMRSAINFLSSPVNFSTARETCDKTGSGYVLTSSFDMGYSLLQNTHRVNIDNELQAGGLLHFRQTFAQFTVHSHHVLTFEHQMPTEVPAQFVKGQRRRA